jgi:hypothetical protein
MPGYILDSGVTIACPHGGQGSVVPRAKRASLGGKPPLLVDDVTTVSGCSFNVSGSPSPCLSVRWQLPATKVSVESTAVLLSSSIGMCVNAAQAPQGTALVTGFQTKVQAR